MDRLSELNLQCKRCMETAKKQMMHINPADCGRFCPIGQEIHKLETKSDSPWNKVDWNTAEMKQYYHG